MLFGVGYHFALSFRYTAGYLFFEQPLSTVYSYRLQYTMKQKHLLRHYSVCRLTAQLTPPLPEAAQMCLVLFLFHLPAHLALQVCSLHSALPAVLVDVPLPRSLTQTTCHFLCPY